MSIMWIQKELSGAQSHPERQNLVNVSQVLVLDSSERLHKAVAAREGEDGGDLHFYVVSELFHKPNST